MIFLNMVLLFCIIYHLQIIILYNTNIVLKNHNLITNKARDIYFTPFKGI